MRDFNNVILIGRLTADPELKATSTGKNVANFRIAVNRHDENADFINIVAWDKLGETCCKWLKKGSKIAVNGVLRSRTHEKDGKKISMVDIVANEIQFLSPKEKTETPPDITAEDFDDLLPFGDMS